MNILKKGENTMSKKIYVKPSKSQSKIGFVAGLIFCLLGIVLVIPTFGLFGICWTLIAVLITYNAWRSGFSEKGVPHSVIEIEDTDDTIKNHSNTKETVEERLKSLQSLYDQRFITKEEYEQKKQEILKDL